MPLQPAHPPAPVSIRLLGQFRLDMGDDPPEREARAPRSPLPRRAAELLQLLSLHAGRSLAHAQVVEALWPDLDPDAGSANLRKAAHHARQFLGQPDALVLRGGRVLLLPDCEVNIDVARFEGAADDALARGDAQSGKLAVQLYAGDLLPEARYESPGTPGGRRSHRRGRPPAADARRARRGPPVFGPALAWPLARPPPAVAGPAARPAGGGAVP